MGLIYVKKRVGEKLLVGGEESMNREETENPDPSIIPYLIINQKRGATKSPLPDCPRPYHMHTSTCCAVVAIALFFPPGVNATTAGVTSRYHVSRFTERADNLCFWTTLFFYSYQIRGNRGVRLEELSNFEQSHQNDRLDVLSLSTNASPSYVLVCFSRRASVGTISVGYAARLICCDFWTMCDEPQ